MADVRIGQPNDTYGIYVSSTRSDLRQARRAALDAIWSLDLYPIAWEEEVAQSERAVAHALTLVDASTAFITIVGHRYGNILPGDNLSIPELEYNRARERSIPILAFMLDDVASVRPQSDIERDLDKFHKLQEFKTRLKTEQLVDMFSSPDELKAKILTSLVKLYRQRLGPNSAVVPIDAAKAQKLQTSTSVIFISYRHEDSIATCLHLAYRLEQHFGEPAVFMDEGSIPPGADWREYIKDTIAQCGVVLAAIGPRWLGITDSIGMRRLDNEDDVLRQEIESALRRRIPVIPVLIDGTRLPRASDLPNPLRPLCDQQGLNLRNSKSDFGNDVQHIIRAVEHWITPLRSTA